MGETSHGQIGRNFKEARCNSVDKTASKGSKTNNDLIEYVSKAILKKE